MPNICFAGIYRNSTPLVIYSTENGTWDKVFLNMCEHGNIKDGVQIMNTNGYLWGILRDKDGLTFFIVTQGFTQQSTEESLQQLKSQFIRSNLDWRNAEQLGLTAEYQNKLAHFVVRSSQQAKISIIKQNMNDTQDGMTSAYGELLIRDMNLNQLGNLSDQLETNTKIYNDEAKVLQRHLCWRKYKNYVFVTLAILVFLYLIIVISCGGFDLKPRCIKPKTTE